MKRIKKEKRNGLRRGVKIVLVFKEIEKEEERVKELEKQGVSSVHAHCCSENFLCVCLSDKV